MSSTTVKCWNCGGSGWLAISEFDVLKCATCSGLGFLCEHRLEYPCPGCIEDSELEYYHYNNEIDHRDPK